MINNCDARLPAQLVQMEVSAVPMTKETGTGSLECVRGQRSISVPISFPVSHPWHGESEATLNTILYFCCSPATLQRSAVVKYSVVVTSHRNVFVTRQSQASRLNSLLSLLHSSVWISLGHSYQNNLFLQVIIRWLFLQHFRFIDSNGFGMGRPRWLCSATYC